MAQPITVLYVDDHVFDHELVREVLKSDAGSFRLQEASSRLEVERYLEQAVDVVLSDFDILGYDGLDVIDHVRERCPEVPLIIVTGTGSEQIAVEAWRRGAADYVIKDAQHIRQLPATIQRVIASRRAQQDHDRTHDALLESQPLQTQRIVRQDTGDIRWVHSEGQVECDHCGAPLRMLGSVQDITHGKQPETDQKRHASFLQELLDSIPNPVFYKAADRRYLGCNRAFTEFYGISKDQIIGKTVYDLVFPDLANVYDSMDRELLETGGTQVYENQFEDSSGRRRDVSFHKATFTDEEGSVAGLIGVIVDLSERKLAECTLRTSEERLQMAIAGGELGIWDWDLLTGELVWGGLHDQLFGFEPGEFDGTFLGFEQRIHPDDLPGLHEELQRAMAERRDYAYDYRVVWPDGTIRWIAGRGHYTYNDQGDPIRMIGTVHDMTDHKHAEWALRKSSRFLQLTLDSLMSHIAILDGQGVIIMVNEPWQTFARLNGVKPEMVSEGVSYLGVCDQATGQGADDARTVASGIRSVLSGQTPRFSHEYDCHSADEQRWFVVHVTRFSQPDVRRVVVAHESITQRKLAEQEVLRHVSELDLVFEMSPVNMVLVDANCRIRRINRSAAELSRSAHAEDSIGILPNDLFGCSESSRDPNVFCDDSLCASCGIRKIVLDTLQTGQCHFQEKHCLRIRRQEIDSRDWLLISTVRLMLDEQPHVLLSIDDITAQEQNERMLRNREAEYVHLNRVNTVGEMATTLAHELNQPLYAINNYVRGVQHRLKRNDGQLETNILSEIMEDVSREVERAANIISHLRELVRQRPPRRTRVDLHEVLRNVCGLLEPFSRDHGVAGKLELDGESPTVYVDATQVEQVIINLVTNAIQAVVDLETQRRRVVVRCQTLGTDFAEIEVRDWGRGIPPALQARIFQPFFTTKTNGLGVGLAISRSIVRSHGGEIWVVHQTPGTAVHVKLPTDNRSQK